MLVIGQIADRDRPGSHMPAADARNQLAQIPHIARIRTVQQILPHWHIEIGNGDVGLEGMKEMARQRKNILASLLQRRHPKYPASDPVVQVVAELAVLNAL